MSFKVCATIFLSLAALEQVFSGGIGDGHRDLNDFPPPRRLRLSIKTASRQMNSAAPQEPYTASKNSLSLPYLSPNEIPTDNIIDDIKAGLQHVLQTKNDWTLVIHGTATTGAHAVLDNLIEPGDKILVGINGYWSGLMANMAERLGANVIRFEKPPGTLFSAQEIENALQIHKPNLVAMVQGESSTTVYQPLEEIGCLCEKYGALLIVDEVAVIGVQPVLADKQKIDAVFASTSKGLGGIVGLSPVSLSQRAAEKVMNRKTPPRAYQTDLVLQRRLWNTSSPDGNHFRFQSLSIPALYAAREALSTIVKEGIQNTFKRHLLVREQLYKGFADLGLQHYVENPEDRLIGITAVYPPTGKSPTKIADYMFRRHNIEISSGFGPTEGKVIRVALFAANAYPDRVENILKGLKDALNSPETNE